MEASDPETLLQLLQAAHAAACRPSIRVLESRTGVSNSVVSRALTGVRLPRSREALLALAAALEADAEEWGRRWDALEAARKQGTVTRMARRVRVRPPCQVEGCPNGARGPLCTTHQSHQDLYGDPTAGRFSPKTHPATCAADDCDRPYYARGLCQRHYKTASSRKRRQAAAATEPAPAIDP